MNKLFSNFRGSQNDQPKRKKVLLTGGTGLLGQYLIWDLLQLGIEPVVLARSTSQSTALDRVRSLINRFERKSEIAIKLPTVIEGDVRLPNLGLRPAELDWVGQHCDSILHSAAVLQFTPLGKAAEPWKTNFGGTKNVLDVSQRLQLKHFHYVSTAYVCGRRNDIVYETQLDCGQDFRNEYERSKFEAEKMVRSASNFDSVSIYRPAVIVGDSQTGFTSSFHGLYLYLRLIATLVPMQQRNAEGRIETPIKLPMNGDEPRNLVPVDWVSRSICELIKRPESYGHTFHLSPEKCSTARQVIDACCEYYNSCGVEFVGADAQLDADGDFAARFFENSNIYRSYETNDPIFDKSNLQRFAGDLRCPAIDKELIWRFLEFGQQQQWGKRKRVVNSISQFDSASTNAVPTQAVKAV